MPVMPSAIVMSCAEQLDTACQGRSTVPLFSAFTPGMSVTDGYRIQRRWSEIRTCRGDSVVGYKIGLTSRAMQSALKVDSPHYGRLHRSMMFASGCTIPAANYNKPRLEVELAFVMAGDLRGPGITPEQALEATGFVQPALELVDYRTAMPRPIMDMVADNTAAAGAILGARTARTPNFDVRWVAATLALNGTIEESGVSAAVLGHPAVALARLANMLSVEGAHLQQGDIVLAGSFTRQVEVKAGDRIEADFGPLGVIEVTFV
jgi:2-oxo-hept-3-ene-1,7-dioate hydratase